MTTVPVPPVLPVLPMLEVERIDTFRGPAHVLRSLSRVATTVVFVALVGSVAYLGWRAGAGPPGRDARGRGRP